MVSDLQPHTIPFVQIFFGGFFLWLGLNIRIITVTPEETTEE